jgi:hypothetical protein
MFYFTKWLILPLPIIIAIAAGVYINKEVWQIKLERQTLDGQNQLISDLASLKSEISGDLESRLIQEDGLGDFALDLEKLSKKYNLNWVFGWSGEKQAPSAFEPGAADFSARAIGSYNNLTAFLKELKNAPYFIRWRVSNFKNLGRIYEASFQGRIFYR